MSAKSIRKHEIHHWLNPLAKQQAAMLTPLTPKEIEDALRPRLSSYNWGARPPKHLNGTLQPMGFSLRRRLGGPTGQPFLATRYQAHVAGTKLEMVYARTAWGIAGWFLTYVFWPVSTVRWLMEFWGSGIFDALGTLWGRLWISGYNTVEQPLYLLVWAAGSATFVVLGMVNGLRSRNDLDFYQNFLSEVIDAREVEES